MRFVAAVVLGYAVWTVICLGGNALFFAEATDVVGRGEYYGEAGPLAGVIGLSIVCSLAAGLVAAWLARERAARAVVSMAVLLLVTGIGVQASAWSLMPAWYHLTFLGLIVPMAILGGRLAAPRHGDRAGPTMRSPAGSTS